MVVAEAGRTEGPVGFHGWPVTDHHAMVLPGLGAMVRHGMVRHDAVLPVAMLLLVNSAWWRAGKSDGPFS